MDDADVIPADVQAVLSQLFAETADALSAGDDALALSLVDTAETVTTNKVPPGERRELLLEGCYRIEDVLDGESNASERRDLAAAYCRRLRESVATGL